MAVIQFKRPEVAAKYEATVSEDINIFAGCYSGKLSNINICGADRMYATKHPAIKLKEAPTPATQTTEES